jgi:hypothetical protein
MQFVVGDGYCTSGDVVTVEMGQFHLPLKNMVFLKYSTNVDIHICTSTHPYEHTHAHHISLSNSERLSLLDIEIHEVGHQERLTVDGDVASHRKNN